MEIRDPVHGSIAILDCEKPIILNPFFQRLRHIKQLGFSEFVFPGATHTRYLHSIGVMHVSSLVFDKLFGKAHTKDYARLRQTLRLACLLHDIGHAPLSHATESVMPQAGLLKLPSYFTSHPETQASHEDYTLKTILDSSLTPSFKLVTEEYGVSPLEVAHLVQGHSHSAEYFTLGGINYFPLLHQLVSSEMDCDRMDYLLRDSYFCGVSYGKYDLDWIIENLKVCYHEGHALLGISERAISTFDDFLISRFHMFMMVYFHYRAVCLEQMLMRYFHAEDCTYAIPSDIEAYLEHDDPFLLKDLRRSQNVWARRIILNDVPQKILETFGQRDTEKCQKMEEYLRDQKIDYLKCSSQGRLSKYYTAETRQSSAAFSMKVLRETALDKHKTHIDVNQATELFERYSQSHAVNRLHCDYHLLTTAQQKALIQISRGQNA